MDNYKESSRFIRKQRPDAAVGTILVDNFVESLHRLGLLPKNVPVERSAPEPLPPHTTHLDEALKEYRSQLHTPELVKATWESIWRSWGRQAALWPLLPNIESTQRDIAELEREDYAIRYEPGIFLRRDTAYYLLPKMFAKMRIKSPWPLEEVTSEFEHDGYHAMEITTDAPHGGTTEEQLIDQFASRRAEGQTLIDYIIGAHFSKLVTDCYFDENGTWSRLLGSRIEGKTVVARFDRNGVLTISNDWHPRYSEKRLGARSVMRIGIR